MADEIKDLLEELDRARPYVHPPDETSTGKSAACWLNPSRICGADCVAFNAEDGLDEDGHPVDSPNKCLFLLYAGQMGSGAIRLLQLAKTAPQPPNVAVPDPFPGGRR